MIPVFCVSATFPCQSWGEQEKENSKKKEQPSIQPITHARNTTQQPRVLLLSFFARTHLQVRFTHTHAPTPTHTHTHTPLSCLYPSRPFGSLFCPPPIPISTERKCFLVPDSLQQSSDIILCPSRCVGSDGSAGLHGSAFGSVVVLAPPPFFSFSPLPFFFDIFLFDLP